MRPLTSVALLLAGDRAKLLAGDGHEGLLHVVALTHAGPTLGVIVHHTDVEREYVYDAQPAIAGQDRSRGRK